MRLVLLPLAFCLLASFSGCTSHQLYGAGQAWQRNECIKVFDQQEHNRCMANTNMSYEDYKRETETISRAK